MSTELDLDYEVNGDNLAIELGQMTVPTNIGLQTDQVRFFEDRQGMEKHQHLVTVVDQLQAAGHWVYGRWDAQKGVSLIVVGATAAAVGIAAGVGYHLIRRDEKPQNNP